MEDGKRMAADGNLLQGQVNENPTTEKKDVDALLKGLIEALLVEQRGGRPQMAPQTAPNDERARRVGA